MSDVHVPKEKDGIVKEGRKQVDEIREQFNDGLLSDQERRRMVIEVWQNTKSSVEKVVDAAHSKGDNSVNNLIRSGARGSISQLTNMGGMKGLIQNPNGDIIEFPITTSYKEGLTPTEYFITTHGSRKGLADTALKTARAGYLTRRLFDVSQDVIITERDCGTKESMAVSKVNALGIEMSIAKNVRGRVLAEDIVVDDLKFKEGTLVTGTDAQQIADSGIDSVRVYSPMMCNVNRGVCAKCYGADLSTWKIVDIGEAVGTVAAQSLGEPSTQLTMNTKHATGASIGGDITQGLPRVEEVIERRNPKSAAAIARIDGRVGEINEDENGNLILIITPEVTSKRALKRDTQYKISPSRMILVKEGDTVKKGDLMTDGSASIEEYYKYAGEEKAREYIITEILKIYDLQGIAVSRKHLEIIVKQMFSRRKIIEAGDTRFTTSQVVESSVLDNENNIVEKKGGIIATAEKVVLGITEVALSRNSWLSSASFQHTTRKLTEDAIRGATDKLVGLKENVILGRLIPAGTGFEDSQKSKIIKDLPPII
jgi:DNA-directed RNA polymerase subunit beta'